MYIYYVLLLVILLAGVKFAGFKGWNEEYMSIDNSKAVQGLCAVLIILHHLSQSESLMENVPLHYVNEVGVLVVGIFFFCSGFGLIKSMQTKKTYFDGFLKKRLVTVLVPFYLINFMYLIYMAYVGRIFEGMAAQEIAVKLVLYITGLQLINSHAWYIVTIVFLYIIFYLLFRKQKNEVLSYSIMGLLVCAYTVAGACLNHGDWWLQGEWWYNTCLLFFIGMLYARFEEKLKACFHKIYLVLLPASIVLFVFVYRANIWMLNNVSYWCEFDPELSQAEVIKGRFMCLGCQLPAVILFVLAAVLIMMKCKFSNPVLKLFGRLSLEIYLCHNMIIMFLRSEILFVKNDILYVGLTVVLAIALAGVVHLLDGKVTGALLKKKE